jgi:DNA-binding HxlR family transcriptional regulator
VIYLKDGIIERKVYAEVPPRVEYKANKLGQTIQPIIAAMKYKKN